MSAHHLERRGGASPQTQNKAGALLQKNGPLASETQNRSANSDPTDWADQAFLAMAERAASVHCALYPCVDGYVITLHAVGLSRLCPDLRTVSRVLRLMGGA